MTPWTPDLTLLSETSLAVLRLLVDVSLKGTAVLLAAAALGSLLRRHAAAARHLVWSLAHASAVVIPVLSFSLPSLQLPIVTLTADAAPAVPASDDV